MAAQWRPQAQSVFEGGRVVFQKRTSEAQAPVPISLQQQGPKFQQRQVPSPRPLQMLSLSLSSAAYGGVLRSNVRGYVGNLTCIVLRAAGRTVEPRQISRDVVDSAVHAFAPRENKALQSCCVGILRKYAVECKVNIDVWRFRNSLLPVQVQVQVQGLQDEVVPFLGRWSRLRFGTNTEAVGEISQRRGNVQSRRVCDWRLGPGLPISLVESIACAVLHANGALAFALYSPNFIRVAFQAPFPCTRRAVSLFPNWTEAECDAAPSRIPSTNHSPARVSTVDSHPPSRPPMSPPVLRLVLVEPMIPVLVLVAGLAPHPRSTLGPGSPELGSPLSPSVSAPPTRPPYRATFLCLLAQIFQTNASLLSVGLSSFYSQNLQTIVPLQRCTSTDGQSGQGTKTHPSSVQILCSLSSPSSTPSLAPQNRFLQPRIGPVDLSAASYTYLLTTPHRPPSSCPLLPFTIPVPRSGRTPNTAHPPTPTPIRHWPDPTANVYSHINIHPSCMPNDNIVDAILSRTSIVPLIVPPGFWVLPSD
ncbi:hypothetical protein CCUS01_16022 [Colletotrichum cuscutae]|uniref:Uncharacterized protein n=1 Tax=Colletotrichum cuscutae TaxID=1209917 RepID=A0AAI9VBX8_9PEZI|nr:hypothetical protein CCUS01_16022 [Colletotrichum cuscutae]